MGYLFTCLTSLPSHPAQTSYKRSSGYLSTSTAYPTSLSISFSPRRATSAPLASTVSSTSPPPPSPPHSAPDDLQVTVSTFTPPPPSFPTHSAPDELQALVWLSFQLLSFQLLLHLRLPFQLIQPQTSYKCSSGPYGKFYFTAASLSI
jgi:hypothetical protein